MINAKLGSNAPLQYEHLPVSQIALDNQFIETSLDPKFNSYNIKEDELLDHLEDDKQIHARGGYVVEYHASELFPERWFDLVIVLRCDRNVLKKRLEQRQYALKKIVENMECEMWNVCLEEAQEAYKPQLIQEWKSSCVDELDENAEKLVNWVGSWIANSTQQ